MARLLAAVVLILAVIWGGLWWYTEGRLHDMLATNARLHTTSNGDSVFGYDSISKGANPLSASATLHNVRWTLQPPGTDGPSIISLAQATVWIDAFNPRVMHIGLPNRIDVSTPKGAASITFGSIAISTGLNPQALFNRNIYALTSQNAVIHNTDVLAGGVNFPVVHIDDIAVHEIINAEAGVNQTALTGTESFDGISLSPVLVALGHVPFGGKISHIAFNMALSGPVDWNGITAKFRATQMSEEDRKKLSLQIVHDWAAQGGNGKASLTVALGPSTLSAGAAVTFDTNAQPNGTADITVDHLDAFTTALTNAYPQLQQSIANTEATLSPYLATTDAGGQMLTIHLAYGKPGVLINGGKKADMPPINWNTLENPPAPPPQASGDAAP